MTEIERPQLNWGEEEKKSFGFLSSFRDLFSQSSLLRVWIVYAAISSFSRIMLRSFQYVYANEVKGADQIIVGGMATAAVLIQILMYTPLGRLSDSIGRKKVIYMLIPVTWVAYLMHIFAPSPRYMLIAGLLAGFINISMIVENAIAAELVPREFMGRWLGVTGLFIGLIDIPAPVIGGLIWERLGPSYIFVLPILIDLLVKIPILTRMPETLHARAGKITT
jgi:MFS family permease